MVLRRTPLSELGENEIPLSETFCVELKGREAPQELSVINWPVFADSIESLEAMLRPFDGEGSEEREKLAEYHKQTLGFAKEMWRKYRS